MVTDYDCWHESREAVTVEMVVSNLLANAGTAQAILKTALPRIAAAKRKCGCADALANAIITRPQAVAPERLETLNLLVGKYLE